MLIFLLCLLFNNRCSRTTESSIPCSSFELPATAIMLRHLVSLLLLMLGSPGVSAIPPHTSCNREMTKESFILMMCISSLVVLCFICAGICKCCVARGDYFAVDAFPTLQYSEARAHKIGGGALQCAVCLNDFKDDETLRLIPICDHVFHRECVDPWLGSHFSCPICCVSLIPRVADRDGESGSQTPRNSELNLEASATANQDAESPPENTDRFTLRLPEECRTRILNRQQERC